MDFKFAFKHMITYFRDQSVDIRIRMMYFLEYASLIACFVGSICMILLKQPFEAMIPNIILFIMSFISLYYSHIKKKYEISTLIMIVGCANIAVPWMFFSAGGNNSGMPIWLIFGVVVTCLMSKGKARALMAIITIVEDLACMLIGYFFPSTVMPLVGENAGYYDMVQSFVVVCVCLVFMLSIYISTYDRQQRQLMEQGIELRKMMQTDALTGVFNRRAYYDEINLYKDGNASEDLVLIAMDVNGLKKVNDELGHSSGDDYIRTASGVITKALGKYGHIFRTGGDEFMAILHCTADIARSFENRIKECIAESDSIWSDQLSIAIGVVCCSEEVRKDITEIEKQADKRMYENKAAYYRNKGIDRRK